MPALEARAAQPDAERFEQAGVRHEQQRVGRQTLEPLADHDDLLLAAYLADQLMTAERVRGELAEQTRRGQLHPVFFGSAITGAGVAELSAGIVALLPTAGGEGDAEPSGSVFKIERGSDGQKVALIRMFNGSLRIRDRLRFGRAEDTVT